MGRVKQCAKKLPLKTRPMPPQGNDDRERTIFDERAAPQAPPPPPRRKRRWRPGTVALQEIRNYQKTTYLLIPRAPFSCLVRDLMHASKFGRFYKFNLKAVPPT